jgi:hypothetical protein
MPTPPNFRDFLNNSALQLSRFTVALRSDPRNLILRGFTRFFWRGPTSAAGRATSTSISIWRTLALEEFKYALESWRYTPAFAWCSSAQLFHCNAWRRFYNWQIEEICFMNILKVRVMKILNFKSSRSLLFTLFVRAARALLFDSSQKLGGVGINDSEDRRFFSDLSQYALC